MLGDIIKCSDEEITFSIDVHASAPIERIDIRNGLETVEIFRPYIEADLGRRIRILWEGSEYRGRGRETIWDGHAELDDNSFQRLKPINRYNIDKRFYQTASNRVEWTGLTTGGFGGFDAWLSDSHAGTLRVDTDLIKEDISIEEIGFNEIIFANGGIDRRIRIFRLPDENPHQKLTLERRMKVSTDRDNAYYVRVTQEDGHFIWSSPIYVFK